MNNFTTQEALAHVRMSLKTAALNKTATVIGATKGGVWRAVMVKGSEGWRMASAAQQAAAIPQGQFPAIPPTALEIYCTLRGWSGGTIHGAIQDLRQQGEAFRERLLNALPAAEWDSTGVDALLGA